MLFDSSCVFFPIKEERVFLFGHFVFVNPLNAERNHLNGRLCPPIFVFRASIYAELVCSFFSLFLFLQSQLHKTIKKRGVFLFGLSRHFMFLPSLCAPGLPYLRQQLGPFYSLSSSQSRGWQPFCSSLPSSWNA